MKSRLYFGETPDVQDITASEVVNILWQIIHENLEEEGWIKLRIEGDRDHPKTILSYDQTLEERMEKMITLHKGEA